MLRTVNVRSWEQSNNGLNLICCQTSYGTCDCESNLRLHHPAPLLKVYPGFRPWCYTIPSVLWRPAADNQQPRILPKSVCWRLNNLASVSLPGIVYVFYMELICVPKGTLARKSSHVFFGPIPQRMLDKKYFQYTSSKNYLWQKSCLNEWCFNFSNSIYNLSHDNLYSGVIVTQLPRDRFTIERPWAEWRTQFLNEKVPLAAQHITRHPMV